MNKTPDISFKEEFKKRHIGIDELEKTEMLNLLGFSSMDEFIKQTIPNDILLNDSLDIDAALSEYEMIARLRDFESKNKAFKSYIGLGYYDTILPAVIQRNILENPGWYTAYTPYQAEISQGRLEALINFQTMIMDLTGMEIANSSLLDEATAAAEAMTMFFGLNKNKEATKYFVDESIFPQTLAVLQTRAEPMGIEIVIGNYQNFKPDASFFGAYLQYPDRNGVISNPEEFISSCKDLDIRVTIGADILSLCLIKNPAELNADCAVGSTQRFGIPMGLGGPHAAYFATKDEYKRAIPGRIIGASKDKHGNNAYRMALQTREQHIRREKATSNICTAQVLLAVMAGMYAVYHGPERLRKIAERTHGLASIIANNLKNQGVEILSDSFFDTIGVEMSEIEQLTLKDAAQAENINFRYEENYVFVSLDEQTRIQDVKDIYRLFSLVFELNAGSFKEDIQEWKIPSNLKRESTYLEHPVFNSFHSEHEMLRYIKSLENKDLSLTHSMISLGSCTMKLNASTEMLPLTWNGFANIHPFAPREQWQGYEELLNELKKDLIEITGFSDLSLQPNSGAQGEYAGLMVIREYFKHKGENHRNIALIPSSAHGTNPASAVMAGMKVVVVKSREDGCIDADDLKKKAIEYKDSLAVLMVTYPSTSGVFEENIAEITKIIHDCGGQVYMDGANMNAQVGLTSPGKIGADVCHLNLHKTFCIPHGGGGPGMGPIGVAEHLAPFLPSHQLVNTGGVYGMNSVSAAPFGSALILIISYSYIKMMGAEGLKEATEIAILNANYLKKRLENHFPALYSGKNNLAAHEFIIDLRDFKKSCGIQVEDIAKRLMDYGYHAPTVSFPVAGTMMIEPTESESKHELDNFIEAFLKIKEELDKIEKGIWSKEDNPVINAPHTYSEATASTWLHSYDREEAVFPSEFTKTRKFWPMVGRIDNTYGDRNLVCSCLPLEAYEQQEA